MLVIWLLRSQILQPGFLPLRTQERHSFQPEVTTEESVAHEMTPE